MEIDEIHKASDQLSVTRMSKYEEGEALLGCHGKSQ
jgi:hypothetical protein